MRSAAFIFGLGSLVAIATGCRREVERAPAPSTSVVETPAPIAEADNDAVYGRELAAPMGTHDAGPIVTRDAGPLVRDAGPVRKSTELPIVDPAADNSGRNADLLQAGKPTADDQNNGSNDIELATRIRRSVVQDDTLSIEAHNVKILVENGNVTLLGTVNSVAERNVIERKAAVVVGAGHVQNNLQVASDDGR
jgi:hyperosmotically inducible protein